MGRTAGPGGAIHVFVLTYNSIGLFAEFFDPDRFPGIALHIVDNGRQPVPAGLADRVVHVTARNIGCAGGVNLIADIGFRFMDQERIVITQDDASYGPADLEALMAETAPGRVAGLFGPFFEFSCFGLHRDTFATVGRFDENCIYGYSEDTDYKHRCALLGIDVVSLGRSVEGGNRSATLKKDPGLDRIAYNQAYIRLKWGESRHPLEAARHNMQPPFTYDHPFNMEQIPPTFVPLSNRIKEVYGEVTELPSETEYGRFLEANGQGGEDGPG